MDVHDCAVNLLDFSGQKVMYSSTAVQDFTQRMRLHRQHSVGTFVYFTPVLHNVKGALLYVFQFKMDCISYLRDF